MVEKVDTVAPVIYRAVPTAPRWWAQRHVRAAGARPEYDGPARIRPKKAGPLRVLDEPGDWDSGKTLPAWSASSPVLVGFRSPGTRASG
jgi:hypothetical protein